MKLVVNKDDCIGCGLCAFTCPEVFSMGEDGKSNVIVTEVPESANKKAAEARDNCPVSAIHEV